MISLEKKLKTRLVSLDVFRGFTVAAMILVNNPGDWNHIYGPLKHAEWNGCTPTDLIFPFFLFIVGVSISFSLKNKKSEQHRSLIWTISKRSSLLFGLGLLLAGFPTCFTDPIDALQGLRILGILQRISLVFFFSAIIFITTSCKTQFKILIGLLVLYWLLLTQIPVPDLGQPSLEKETNLCAWIDRTLLGTAHLWKLSVTWDPEGILGTIPAISTGLFGVLIGTYLQRKDREENVKILWISYIGFVSLVLGLLWDFTFPINKALWTSSYVLYTGGIASIAFAFCYWIIDIQGYRKWTLPFVVYGVNALAAFFLSTLMAKVLNIAFVKKADGTLLSTKNWLYENLLLPSLSPINASLAIAFAFVLCWFLILCWMYRKNILIKI